MTEQSSSRVILEGSPWEPDAVLICETHQWESLPTPAEAQARLVCPLCDENEAAKGGFARFDRRRRMAAVDAELEALLQGVR